MRPLDEVTLNLIRADLDGREDIIRGLVYETLAGLPAPDLSESIVCTYWVLAHTLTPAQVGREIAYHMTSGVRSAPAGSLLARCGGTVVDEVQYDATGRMGLVRVAFPLAMLLDENGDIYSTDILHIVAGEGAFGLTENADVKLCHIAMSDEVLGKFPGPAYGAPGARRLAGFGADEIAFGTILKPCTGITPAEEAHILEQVAANPLFLFIKEDENFLPGVPFAPLAVRCRTALAAIERVKDQRGGKGLIYAPHITSPPHLLADNVQRALDAGVNGVMFSEYFIGGATRMVRELTRHLSQPPAIYGHNGGISVRTRHIWREVLDLLARLDGVDFRQTAPLTAGQALLRPAGQEWRECEKALSMPLAGHPPVMIARAGGLDQGNIIQNLIDISRGAGPGNYLFLAGSAINGIKNAQGEYDSVLGSEAMRQAIEVHHARVFDGAETVGVAMLKDHAQRCGLTALATALAQRYKA